jgi:hypothetical protein
MDAHLRAAETHDKAARLFARLGNYPSAARESELAAAQRCMHAEELARHPEWAP